MSTLLRDLFNQSEKKYKLKLICGEANMDNLVQWVHMLEDPETASFLHGQELIFTTGIGHSDTSWLLDFAKNLVKYQASGLVLNIGPYIKSIPKELIDFCKDKQFPLFTIPWETRIVDISNDFCRKIISGEETKTTVAEAFRNIIFSPDNADYYKSILEKNQYDLNAEFAVIALSLEVPTIENFSDFEKIVRMHLTKILFRYSDRFSMFKQDKYLIIVLQNFTCEEINEALDRLHLICNNKSFKIRAGITPNEIGINKLPKSYKRAISVLKLAIKQNLNKLCYQDINFYQLLIEVEDIQVLERFYKDSLGKLEEYDKKNDTDYLNTLKYYLEFNGRVQEVAKATYVHRNTINYKIKKIKEILNCDINFEDGTKLLLAFHIKELL